MFVIMYTDKEGQQWILHEFEYQQEERCVWSTSTFTVFDNPTDALHAMRRAVRQFDRRGTVNDREWLASSVLARLTLDKLTI